MMKTQCPAHGGAQFKGRLQMARPETEEHDAPDALQHPGPWQGRGLDE